jgi:hypothetical protein
MSVEGGAIPLLVFFYGLVRLDSPTDVKNPKNSPLVFPKLLKNYAS